LVKFYISFILHLSFTSIKIETALLIIGIIAAGVIIISSAATPVFAQQVLICHQGRAIEVGIAAVPAHLAHGDLLGPCAI
jgi:hypothetical protein